MKVFIYSKKDNHTVKIIEHVRNVIYTGDTIEIIDEYDNIFKYYTKYIKTRIYQN